MSAIQTIIIIQGFIYDKETKVNLKKLYTGDTYMISSQEQLKIIFTKLQIFIKSSLKSIYIQQKV